MSELYSLGYIQENVNLSEGKNKENKKDKKDEVRNE